MTRRAFCGYMRTCRADIRPQSTELVSEGQPYLMPSVLLEQRRLLPERAPPPSPAQPLRRGPCGSAGRSRFAQLVSNHLLVYIHRNELFPIVHGVGNGLIKSGTIVERRDQVMTHYFSLRVFSPSTIFVAVTRQQTGYSFRERAISLLYSSTGRKRPQGACRIFLNPRTGPGTRCDFGQNGQTNLVPIAFGARSTITAHPGLQSLYNAGSNGTAGCFLTSTATFATTFATGFGAARFATRLLDRFAPRRTAVRRPAVRLVRVARIASALHSQCA